MAFVNISIINRKFQDINPLVFGWEDCAKGHCFGPHIRDYYLIHYVRAGKGVLENSDGVFPVEAGQIFIIHPGQVTTYTADKDDPWKYIWIGFNGKAAERLDTLNKWVIPYSKDTFFTMRKAERLDNTREEFLAGQTFLLLSSLLEHGESGSPGYVQQVTDFILSNFMYAVRIEQIADMIGLDRRYLTRIFKQETGRTIQEFLIETRLGHAAEYLRQGKSVTDTAALSGYTDTFHFSKMFKKRYDVSPQQYKKYYQYSTP